MKNGEIDRSRDPFVFIFNEPFTVRFYLKDKEETYNTGSEPNMAYFIIYKFLLYYTTLHGDLYGGDSSGPDISYDPTWDRP